MVAADFSPRKRKRLLMAVVLGCVNRISSEEVVPEIALETVLAGIHIGDLLGVSVFM